MKVNQWIAGFSALCFVAAALAQETEHKLGQHPAVLAKQKAEHAPYDYQAQFYPHPAWLYLRSEPARPMMDHPAVIVFKREREQRTQLSARTPRDVDASVAETH
jgi:hypothetical protein